MEPTLSPHELRTAAVAGQLDPRTIVAYLEGRRQRSTTRARVEHALAAIGRANLVRVASEKPNAGGR